MCDGRGHMRNRKMGTYACVALPVKVYAAEDIILDGEIRYKKGEYVTTGCSLLIGSYLMRVPRIRFNLRTIKGAKR